jgi:quinol monooxygenase YgiN
MEHSRRSRGEKGCLLHAVHRDLEEPTRLVFVEEWEDRLSLDAHFSLRSSRDFVRSARRMAAQEPVIQVFEAARVDI